MIEQPIKKVGLKKLKSFIIVLFCWFALLAIICFPYIRGGYRLRQFESGIKLGQNREQVLLIAEKIGYHHKELETPKEMVAETFKGYNLVDIADTFYFDNVMLDSILSIQYDKQGNVTKIIID